MATQGEWAGYPASRRAIAVCAAVQCAVAVAVWVSPWGSLLVMDGHLSLAELLVPCGAGVAAGLLTAWAFGPFSPCMAAAVLALFGLATLFFAYPAVITAVGAVAGALLSDALCRRCGTH